jgi:hypothetical protein
MSDIRASLPHLAVGSAVLAADAAKGLVRRASGAATTQAKAAATQAQAAAAAPLQWVESALIPKIIDDLMPYLIASVMPRIIDGALPYVREHVMPILIDDLTESPQLRELITEQSRDVVADAATDLRGGTATADDRLESGVRRVLHLPAAQ